MSKVSRITALAVAFLAAWGSASARAGTIEDLANAQRERLIAEAQKGTQSNGQMMSTPAISASAPHRSSTTGAREHAVDDLRLIGLYGVGSNLTADIYYNGVVFSVKEGATTVDGWKAEKIEPTRIVLSRQAGKRSRRTHVLYLSAPTQVYSASADGNAEGGMRPPISPGGGPMSRMSFAPPVPTSATSSFGNAR